MVDARQAVASTGANVLKAALKGLSKPDALALRASLAARISAVQGIAQRAALLSGTVAAVPGEVAALVSGAPAAFGANPLLLVRLPAILIQIEKQAGNVAALTTSVTALVGGVAGLGTDLGGIKSGVAKLRRVRDNTT